MMTISDIKAMERAARERLLRLNPDLCDDSGIYICTRTDEDGVKYAYVGQSKHVLVRLTQHILGTAQAVDMGLRQRGLYDASKNPFGYRIGMLPCAKADLDTEERRYTLAYAKKGGGYQVQNRTTGGSKGKRLLGDKKPASDYAKGIAEGRRQMAQEIQEIIAALYVSGDEVLKRRLREVLSESEEKETA